MKLSNIEQKNVIIKITESDTFKNAPTSIALLQYLYKASSENTNLKETLIDIEFFGSKKGSEKNTTRVRVNIYNLRKKLVAYYESEGKDEKWQVSIPKGQYQITFTKTQSELKRIKTNFNWKIAIPYTALCVCLSYIVVLITPATKPKIWKPFLNENSKTKLFIGDLFGISGTTITNHNGWTRDFHINSSKDFYHFIDQNPSFKDKIHPSNYTYTTTMAAIAAQKIQSLSQTHNKTFPIRFTTKSSISEIKQGNAIYTGPIKTNNLFIPFFNEGNKYCTIQDKKLFIKNHPSIKDISYNLNSFNDTEEYAIVSLYPATGNTKHFVFFSQHDIGVNATIEYFTNNDSLQKFSDNYLKDKEFFTAIFKVKGQDRTSIDLKLVSVIPF